jgi:hypothetical protein
VIRICGTMSWSTAVSGPIPIDIGLGQLWQPTLESVTLTPGSSFPSTPESVREVNQIDNLQLINY